MGEAINGPGGYFGWNLDALDECVTGQFGAHPPFRLVWHDSAIAADRLVVGHDRRKPAPAIPLSYLLDMLSEHHIEVDLR
ncbi:barstar family protein [Saccharothrix luteola]|uniref:barstar family protein n=1 Tax=Saccharothrix luteola TaxID=2893018 RepID=UPI001E3E74E6|nr:barstar family protein [Saccharothrix luteola]MCC8247074.1 barstar family protein [Saccharothrix luteola]